jgi:hypothetical protein
MRFLQNIPTAVLAEVTRLHDRPGDLGNRPH